MSPRNYILRGIKKIPRKLRKTYGVNDAIKFQVNAAKKGEVLVRGRVNKFLGIKPKRGNRR